MGNVKIVFTAETAAALSAVQRFTGQLQSTLQQAAGTLLTAFSVHTIGRWIARHAEAADQTGKTAQKVGLTAEEFSKLSGVMKQGDVDQGQFLNSSRELLKWMQANGQAGRSLTEVLIEQADVLASIENPAQRAAKAAELFGRLNGLAMIPVLSQGSEKLREQIAAMERLGLTTEEQARISDEYNDALGELNIATDSFSRTLVVSMLPSMTAVVNQLTNFVGGLNTFISTYPAAVLGLQALTAAVTALATAASVKLVAGLAGLAGAGSVASSAILALGAAITGWKVGSAIGELNLLGMTIKDRVEASILGAWLAWEKFKNALGADNLDEIKNLEESLRDLMAAKTALEEENKPIKKPFGGLLSKEELDQQRKLIDERIDGIRVQEEAVRAEIEASGGKTSAKQIEILRSQNEAIKALLEERSAIVYDSATTEPERLPYFNQDIRDLTKNRLEGSKIVDPNSITEQLSAAFTEIETRVGTTAQIIGRALTSGIGGAITAISEGISGLIDGTLTWGQALEQIGTGVVKSVINAFSQMVAEWFFTHVAMQGISWASKAVISGIRAVDTAEHAAHVATQVTTHATGEGAKTGATLFGSIGRGAIRLGETLFHGVQVAIRVAAHIAGEVAMTVASVAQSAIRIAKILAEAMVWLVQAAFKGAGAVASIPYVGPFLAVAALGAILAAGAAALSGFKDGGEVHGGEQVIRVNEEGTETVMNAQATARYRPLLALMNAGQFDLSERLRSAQENAASVRAFRVATPITSDPQKLRSEAPGLLGGAGASATPQVNVSAPPAQIVIVDSEAMARQVLESGRFGDAVVSHWHNNRHRYGES